MTTESLTDGPLSKADLEQFHERGYIKLRAWTTEESAKMEEAMWRALSRRGDVSRDDPSTWRKPKGVSRGLRSTRLFRDAISQDFLATITQLLGPNWIRPTDWGRTLYTFPSDEPWNVSWRQWHWHGSAVRNADTLSELTCFFFINRVVARGGGTLLCGGSHRVVEKYLSELTQEQREAKKKQVRTRFYKYDPWIKKLTKRDDTDPSRMRFMEEEAIVQGFPCRVFEATGEPGEAYITSGSLLHAVSRNCGDGPRFMRTVDIRLPFDA